MNIHDKHTNNQINSPLIQMLTTLSYLTGTKSQICFDTKTLYLFFSFSLIHFSMFLIRKTLKVFENDRKKTKCDNIIFFKYIYYIIYFNVMIVIILFISKTIFNKDLIADFKIPLIQQLHLNNLLITKCA